MTKALIATPVYKWHDHTRYCVNRDTNRGFELLTVEGCAYVDMARGLLAKLVHDALDRYDEIDSVVWLDNDMRWTESDIDLLVLTVREIFAQQTKTPLIHATYARRGNSGLVCHQRAIGEDGYELPPLRIHPAVELPAVVGGLGFCAIHREGFLRFAAKCKEYLVPSFQRYALDMFPTGIVDGQWYGEDILHCVRQFAIGDGSYWLPQMMVEHMASDYGPPLAPRYPSVESLDRLTFGIPTPEKTQPDHEPPQHDFS